MKLQAVDLDREDRLTTIHLLESILFKMFDEGLGSSIYNDLINLKTHYEKDGVEQRVINQLLAEVEKEWGDMLSEAVVPPIIEVGGATFKQEPSI